jgi:hypothetical protein
VGARLDTESYYLRFPRLHVSFQYHFFSRALSSIGGFFWARQKSESWSIVWKSVDNIWELVQLVCQRIPIIISFVDMHISFVQCCDLSMYGCILLCSCFVI